MNIDFEAHVIKTPDSNSLQQIHENAATLYRLNSSITDWIPKSNHYDETRGKHFKENTRSIGLGQHGYLEKESIPPLIHSEPTQPLTKKPRLSLKRQPASDREL